MATRVSRKQWWLENAVVVIGLLTLWAFVSGYREGPYVLFAVVMFLAVLGIVGLRVSRLKAALLEARAPRKSDPARPHLYIPPDVIPPESQSDRAEEADSDDEWDDEYN